MRLAVLGDTQYMPAGSGGAEGTATAAGDGGADALMEEREARGAALRLLLPALAAAQEALPEGYCRSVCNATLGGLEPSSGTAAAAAAAVVLAVGVPARALAGW